MAVISLSRARMGADPSRHNPPRGGLPFTSPRLAAHHRECPDSPTGHHLRRRGELRCLCCRCRLPISANVQRPAAPIFGDTVMSVAMAPTIVNAVRLAFAQAEKLVDASVEGSPAEDRYRRLAGHLDAALAEIADTEVLS